MSHFKVLCIGEDYESQLAPYCEQDAEYQEFCAVDLEEYKNKYDKYLSETDKASEDFCDTFDKYMDDYCGYIKEDDEWGYYSNSDAKWDWYVVGGRYCGGFKLKLDESGKSIDPEAELNPHWSMDESDRKYLKGRCDSTLKKNIDFDGMLNDKIAEAKKRYKKVYSKLSKKDFEGFITWKELVVKIDNKELSVEEAREFYHSQNAIKVKNNIKDICKRKSDKSFWTWLELDEYANLSQEEYVKSSVKHSFTCYAILKDGEWFEKGTMGWWGISTNEMDEDKWINFIKQTIDECSDDELLTIVDCHI